MQRNLLLFKILAFFSSLRAFEGIWVVYLASLTGSFATAMSVLAVMTVSMMVFEVPTGILSDFIGRKKTMQLYYLLYAVASLVFFLFTDLWLLMVGAAILGISLTFRSGTIAAYHFETLESLGKEKEFSRYEGSRRSIEKIGVVVATVIGAILIATVSMQSTFLVTVVGVAIALIISFFLVDTDAHEDMSGNIYSHLVDAWKDFRDNAQLRNLTLGNVIATGFSNTTYRFKSLYFATLIPEWLINIVSAFSNLISATAMKYTHKIVDRFGEKATLVNGGLLARFFTAVFILVDNVVTPFLISVSDSSYYASRSIAMSDIAQKLYSKKRRATMGSLENIAISVLYAVFGVALGFVGDLLGAKTTFLLAQGVIATSVFFFWKGFRRDVRV